MKALDAVLAFLSIAAFVGFLAIVANYVEEIDLMVVIGVVSAMAVFDFWRAITGRR